jgi:hypothetical protein
MDKKIIYGIGGVAVIGIIAYLYNKKKKDEATKITTMADAPVVNSEIINSMVVETMANPDTGLINPPVFDEPNPIVDTNVIINPDGTWVDTSLVSISTNPNTSTTPSTTAPTRVPTNQTATSPITFTDPKNMTTATSAPARFDGGFANAIGSTSLSKDCYYVNEITGYYPSGHPIVQKKLVCKTATAKFDGGFDYADGYGCSVDPTLGF